MDLIKILATPILIGAMASPALATESNYEKFVNGALEVYKQFHEPSVQESKQFLDFITNNYNTTSRYCVSDICTVNGKLAGETYAMVNKVKMDDEIQ